MFLPIDYDSAELVYVYREKDLNNNIYYWCGRTSLNIALLSYRFSVEHLGKKLSGSIHPVTSILIFPITDLLGTYLSIENGEILTWCDNCTELRKEKS